MARPRSQHMSRDSTAYYAARRCVRRALLCGDDALTGPLLWPIEKPAKVNRISGQCLFAFLCLPSHFYGGSIILVTGYKAGPQRRAAYRFLNKIYISGYEMLAAALNARIGQGGSVPVEAAQDIACGARCM